MPKPHQARLFVSVSPREGGLLGHWGSAAGQCFTYIHFNRLTNKCDLKHRGNDHTRTIVVEGAGGSLLFAGKPAPAAGRVRNDYRL